MKRRRTQESSYNIAGPSQRSNMSTWEQAESIAFYTTDLPPNDSGVLRRDKIPTEVEISMLTGAPYNPVIPREIAFRHTIFDPERHLPRDDVRRTMQQLQVFPLAMLKNQTTRPLELAMFRKQGEGPLRVPPFDPTSAYARAKGMLPFTWQEDTFDRMSSDQSTDRSNGNKSSFREAVVSTRNRSNRETYPISKIDANETKRCQLKRPPLSLSPPEPTNFEKKAIRKKKNLEESIRLRRRLRLLDSHLENMPDEKVVVKKTDYSVIGKMKEDVWRSGGSTAPVFKRRPNDNPCAHEQVPPDASNFRGFLDRTYVPANVTANRR